VNRGPGIQHIALQTLNIVQAIAHLLWCILPPSTPQLLYPAATRTALSVELEEIAKQILVDWEKTTSRFTITNLHPANFDQPTFF